MKSSFWRTPDNKIHDNLKSKDLKDIWLEKSGETYEPRKN